VSRRAGVNSSWKTPVASCARWLNAVRTISSVSRCATKTSVFSFASRQRSACDTSRGERRSRGEGALDAIDFLPSGNRMRGRHPSHFRFDHIS
jgi:hypothetical protein